MEEVPITESRDYSEPDIIYDVTKDGFDDDVDTFSVPVAVAFNVPETETPVVIQTSTVSQEVTTSDVIETETSTAPVIETTTIRETVPTTTVEEIQSSTQQVSIDENQLPIKLTPLSFHESSTHCHKICLSTIHKVTSEGQKVA